MALKTHYRKIRKQSLNNLFEADPDRFKNFSYSDSPTGQGILIDYSKNHITQTTLDLLTLLAVSRNVPDALRKLNAGEIVNFSENRAARHSELRKPKSERLAEIQTVLNQIEDITQKIQQDRQITDILTLGIGGSNLGPQMACEALYPYAVTQQKFHFVSTLDAHQIDQTLKKLKPQNTVVIISSKSFTTSETVLNSKITRKWLGEYFNTHCYAITENINLAENFGIPKNHILPLWTWVGGRYSIWSAISLPLAIQIGMKNFEDFLAGGYQMDQEVLKNNTPENLHKNIAVILAVINHWYINFFNTQTRAILPYDIRLASLPNYLQQLEMESNGKNISQEGKKIKLQTGPIIWGSAETDGQHAFHQLLHQGTQITPIDFIAVRKPHHGEVEQHRLLFANCLSQAHTLMTGQKALLPYKKMPGNRPSTIIALPELNPFYLGFLIALYEYKVFISAVLWNINPFDQWGVELGKKMAGAIAETLKNSHTAKAPDLFDTSTRGLIEWFSKEC